MSNQSISVQSIEQISIIYKQLLSMHQEYLNLLMKFYEKVIQRNKQSGLLLHSLQRFLNYQFKQEQKMIKQKQKEGSDYKSFHSNSSNNSLNSFEKVKKLFYSNHIETSVLFYYFLTLLKNKKMHEIASIFSKIEQKIKTVDKSLSGQDKRKYNAKVNRFKEYLQFLQGKVNEGRPIDWIYFQVFKQFQSETVLTAQLISSQGGSMQTKESIKSNNYLVFLTALNIECHIFDYVSRQASILGVQGHKIFIGKRSDTFFVLTESEFQKARKSAQNRQVLGLNEKRTKITNQQQQKVRDLKKYSTNKFKQQFLSQMVKLRQSYQINTSTIASLFNFKDAGQGGSKLSDSANQA